MTRQRYFAEGAAQLSEWFVLPRVPPELPRQLASKRGLYQLCCRLGIPTPDAFFPETLDDVESYAVCGTFPMVAKTWTRGTACAAPPTQVRPSSTPQVRSGGSPQVGQKGRK
jgi:predicted ATP-grasp superfamily ATP-dependent carboligase